MSDTTAKSTLAVAVCDWNGRLLWTTRSEPCCSVGTPIWEKASPDSQETVKAAISRVVTSREPQKYEATDHHGDLFYVWLWPMNSPEIAVCVLSLQVPKETARLSLRERDCLQLLSEGLSPATIADQLDISVSTTHTHLKRSREKLGVESLEALISYAARYFQTPVLSQVESEFGDRTRSNGNLAENAPAEE